MKTKRIVFVFFLIIFSVVCFQIMNNKYDRLARYNYATKENRDIILENMNDDEIDYIIQQKIKPEQFMDFILLEGFVAKNTLYYDLSRKIQPVDLNYIVGFVNKYKEQLKYGELEGVLMNYPYAALEEYYSGAYSYIKNSKLIFNANEIDLKIADNMTLYKYVPQGLLNVDNNFIPSAPITHKETIQVKQEMIEPLSRLCNDLAATNGLTCGGLILTKGFISYEDQISLYEQDLVKYGVDKFKLYNDFPGQSEFQLGYSITFTISSMDEAQIKESEQVKWISENAKKYGFVLRYPLDSQAKTGKEYQPLTLRYLGSDITLKDGFSASDTFKEK